MCTEISPGTSSNELFQQLLEIKHLLESNSNILQNMRSLAVKNHW